MTYFILTNWFNNNNIRPFHVGIYKISTNEDYSYPFFSYWNGKYWGYECRAYKDAYEQRNNVSDVQNKYWCGIKK